jgi:hypothetical protein
MNFESLANELLLDLFEYLSSVDLLRSFYKLNHRLNNLLFLHFQNFGLDFRSISQNDFNLICTQYLPNIVNHIKSLRLTNDDDTPQQIELFYSHGLTIRQFNSLQSLSICDLCSNELMNKILLELNHLPNLTHLTLAGCYLQYDEFNEQHIIDSIWSLPKLIYCYLNISYGEMTVPIPTVMSLSLKYLSIWGKEYHRNKVNALLKQAPCLEHLSVLLYVDNQNDNNTEYSISSITKLALSLSQTYEDNIIKFFQTTPYLCQLIIDIDCENPILNGYQWENIIRNYLPNLQLFRLKMLLNFIVDKQEQRVNDLLNSFQTPFWIDEHHWYVRCHWNSNSIYLYTLPYAFKSFDYDSRMQFKSTCPDDKRYLNYNNVDRLGYKSSSMEQTVLSPIRFMNVNQLFMERPIDDNFWSMMPKLDQVTSLDVLVDYCNDEFQLQELVNKMPRLRSLNFSFLFMSLLEVRNASIRRLDLRGYDRYFDDTKCLALSRPALGIQCEILFIRIENRRLLIDLINNMINLRTLNVQCKDDKMNETNEDELILWIKDHLPSTCIISRDTVFHLDIRIWIR